MKRSGNYSKRATIVLVHHLRDRLEGEPNRKARITRYDEATLKVWIGDELSQETALYAAETVEKGDLKRQAFDALKELLFGWL